MSAPAPTLAPRSGLSSSVIIALAALLVMLVLGLVWLAGPTGRTETLGWLSGVFGIVASLFAAAGVVQNHALSSSVETVRTQTNGSLDTRILAAVASALAAVGATPQTPVQVSAAVVSPGPVPDPLPVVPALVQYAPADTLSHVPTQPSSVG